MKLTKKDFFDGEEMTEREMEIYEEGVKKGEESWFLHLLGGFIIGIIVATLCLYNNIKH